MRGRLRILLVTAILIVSFVLASCAPVGPAALLALAAGGGGSGGGGEAPPVNKAPKPAIVGSCDTPGSAYGVYISGAYAYVADGASGLQVISVSNPASPIFVGSYDTPDYAESVYVNGAYAYVADYSSGLQVIRIFK